MHICTCCLKEFHTRFLLNRHIAASTVCQHHFSTERLNQELESIRADLAVKNAMVVDLVKANMTLTQRFVELSQIQNSSLLPREWMEWGAEEPSQNSNLPVTDSRPSESVMRLLERSHPLLPNPTTLSPQEGCQSVTTSDQEPLMRLLERSC